MTKSRNPPKSPKTAMYDAEILPSSYRGKEDAVANHEHEYSPDQPLGAGHAEAPCQSIPDKGEAHPIQRCDIVSILAIRFLQKYPASTNADCWDHVVYVGRSHPQFIRSHERGVTFRPRTCNPPKTLTRHQFAKRMFFIRQIRQKPDLKLPSK